MLFDILCTFNSTEDSGLEFLKHLCRVSNGTVFCNRTKTSPSIPTQTVIMLHVFSMINEPSYSSTFDAGV